MLEQLPKISLKKIEKTLLYSKNTQRSRSYQGSWRQDLNIDERITKFQNQLKNKYVYRIPLRYLTDLGKINFPLKTDFRIKCHLETDLKKLFESKKVLAATAGLPSPDAKIVFTKAPFMPSYEQLLLDKNVRQYLETIMISKKILHMGAQHTPI